MGNFAVFVQHERAAFDTQRFLAVEFFQLDNVKLLTDGLIFVAQ